MDDTNQVPKELITDPEPKELSTGEDNRKEIPLEGDPSLLACQKDRDEFRALAQRLKADFENYKKDEARKFGAAIEYSNYAFVATILPILDDFDRAEKNAPPDLKKTEWFLGMAAIIAKLKKELEGEGLKGIEAMGKAFDPYYHEALGYVETESGAEGIIVEEYKKGYMFKEKLARPSSVMLSRVKKKE